MSPHTPYPRRRSAASRTAASQPPPARAGARVIAYLVDVAVVAAHVAASRLWRPSAVLAVIVATEVTIVLMIARAATGRSPGALLTGTATVHAGTDRAPGLGREVVRGLLLVILSATGVGGVITLVLGRNGRSWVDRVAGTAEVNLRAKTPRSGLANLPNTGAADGEPTLISPALSWQGPAAPSTPVGRLPEQPAPEERPAEPAASAMPSAEDYPRPAAPAIPEPPIPATPAIPRRPPSEPQTLMAPAPSPDRDRPRTRALDRPPAPPTRYRGSAPVPLTESASPPPAASPPAHPAPAAAPIVPGAPSPAPVPSPAEANGRHRAPLAPVVWIVMDSGEREPVDTVLVLGRAPTSSDPSHRLVTITDPTRSLSRTHLRLGPTGQGVWAEDMFSANGTLLRLADGSTHSLPRGERVELDVGSALVIGERTLTIA